MDTSIHQANIAARFSSAAHSYEAMSQLQDRVARRLMDILPTGATPRCVLDAGCGTGRIIYMVRKRWPSALCTGVDIAPGMIEEASRHLGRDPQVELHTADIVDFQAAAPYDLILSSSSLHWLRPFPDGLARTLRLCAPGGIAAISIMLDGTLAELHASRRAVAPGKPPGGRLPTLEEFEAAANAVEGFRVRRIEHITAHYDQATARDVLKTVHAMGVTGGDVSRSHAPLSRGELGALCDHYQRSYATDNGVSVTFEVGYLLVERV